MYLAIVFNLFITFNFNYLTVIQYKTIGCICEVFLFNENTLESFRVKTESCATLQAFFMGIGINILEIFIGIVGWYIRCLGNR